ncbi:MAG: ATP synthase F0 subunit A [Rickettsiales bacterium]|nr:MAG: ATP synthase F0 subunit A [Rickettsiales bacterium]
MDFFKLIPTSGYEVFVSLTDIYGTYNIPLISNFEHLISSPLDQFQIYPVFGSTVTNFLVSGLLSLIICFTLSLGGSNEQKISSGSWRTTRFMIIENIFSLVKEQLNKNSREYFGVILTLFVGTACFNVLGLMPYTFTITSHVAITLAFSFPIFTAMTLEGLYRHKLEFFSLFLPGGTPILLAPILTIIEFISYMTRLASLAVRFAANLIAGHVILKIIATTCASLLNSKSLMAILSVIPLGAMFVFTALELAVAFLQSYVLCILTCNYLNDGINLH